MAKKSRQNTTTVLATQNLKRARVRKRRRPGERGALLRFVLVLGVAALTVASAIYFHQTRDTSTTPEKAIAWRISVDIAGSSALAEQIKRSHEIGEKAAQLLASNQNQGLDTVAQLLQAHFHAQRVTLLRTLTDKLHIRVEPRQPVMRVHADQTRLVTPYGQVYGDAEARHDELALLTGLLDRPQRPYQWHPDVTLKLNDSQQARIMQALALVDQADNQGLLVAHVRYVTHRGFEVTFKDPPLTVMFGYEPFSNKLTHLKDLIDKSIANGQEIVRIELDYNGKAFIKERKL